MGLYSSFQHMFLTFNLLCLVMCFYVFIPQLNRHAHAYRLQTAEKPLSVIEFRVDQRGEMPVHRRWCRVQCYRCWGKCWVTALKSQKYSYLYLSQKKKQLDVQNVISIHIFGAEITGCTLRWSSGVVREKNAGHD